MPNEQRLVSQEAVDREIAGIKAIADNFTRFSLDGLYEEVARCHAKIAVLNGLELLSAEEWGELEMYIQDHKQARKQAASVGTLNDLK